MSLIGSSCIMESYGIMWSSGPDVKAWIDTRHHLRYIPHVCRA